MMHGPSDLFYDDDDENNDDDDDNDDNVDNDDDDNDCPRPVEMCNGGWCSAQLKVGCVTTSSSYSYQPVWPTTVLTTDQS